MQFSQYYKSKDVAEGYDSRRMQGVKAQLVRLMEKIAVVSLIPPGKKKILEAGVGTGYFTELLAKMGDLEGVDISEEMLNVLRKKIKGVKLKKANILSMKLNKKYDVIVSVRVISHFNKSEALQALRNLSAHAKPNGVIIFNLENPSVLRKTLRKITNWGSTYTYQYSDNEVNSMLRLLRLNVKNKIYVDHIFLYPLHLINKIVMGYLSGSILKLENMLEKVKFCSANVFIKCLK